MADVRATASVGAGWLMNFSRTLYPASDPAAIFQRPARLPALADADGELSANGGGAWCQKNVRSARPPMAATTTVTTTAGMTTKRRVNFIWIGSPAQCYAPIV